MWTRFVSDYVNPIPDNNEYDFVFFECNEVCARTFLNLLIRNSKNYNCTDSVAPPILNVEYLFCNNFHIRIYTLEELIRLGLIDNQNY